MALRILFHKALWGMPQNRLAENLERIKASGYDGVEGEISGAEPGETAERCRQLGLDYVAQVIADDAEGLIEGYKRSAEAGASMVNMHAGKDHFSFDDGCRIFERVLAAEAETGVPIVQETHRGRLLYAPWTTAEYLRRFPELRLNADFSHWCCVTESVLQFVPELVEEAIARSFHVHTRVGHPEGPQVNDPAAPENAEFLSVHMGWWKKIKAARAADGTETLRYVPEFGPPPYLPLLPYTRQPVVDLWEVCLWTREAVKQELGGVMHP